MDASQMTEADAALLRARLHIRGCRRRFQRGMWADGIVSLYDALQHAMRWYVSLPEHRARLGMTGGEDLGDDRAVWRILVHGGVLDHSFDFDEFEALVGQAVGEGSFQCDADAVMRQIEKAMTALEVMPFDEAALPREKPGAL